MQTNIDRKDVQQLLSEGAQLIDVLPANEYAEAHLPGAANIPLKQLNPGAVAHLNPQRPIVVYCYDSL